MKGRAETLKLLNRPPEFWKDHSCTVTPPRSPAVPARRLFLLPVFLAAIFDIRILYFLSVRAVWLALCGSGPTKFFVPTIHACRTQALPAGLAPRGSRW